MKSGQVKILMSHEELNDFIHAAERSLALRKELKDCNNYQMILDLAKKLGFNISLYDLQDDIKDERIREWFESSKINPIKNPYR